MADPLTLLRFYRRHGCLSRFQVATGDIGIPFTSESLASPEIWFYLEYPMYPQDRFVPNIWDLYIPL